METMLVSMHVSVPLSWEILTIRALPGGESTYRPLPRQGPGTASAEVPE
jgi:hypothetical protein